MNSPRRRTAQNLIGVLVFSVAGLVVFVGMHSSTGLTVSRDRSFYASAVVRSTATIAPVPSWTRRALSIRSRWCSPPTRPITEQQSGSAEEISAPWGNPFILSRLRGAEIQARAPPTAEQRWLNSPAARCVKWAESKDNYTEGGLEPYGGAWQFSVSTWQAKPPYGIGETGLPNEASPARQDAAAYKLWRLAGWGQWETAPGCGV